MVRPEEIRKEAKTLHSLMSMFEHSYLKYLELFEIDTDIETQSIILAEKEEAAISFYHIKEILEMIVTQMCELSHNIDVCDVIRAARRGSECRK